MRIPPPRWPFAGSLFFRFHRSTEYRRWEFLWIGTTSIAMIDTHSSPNAEHFSRANSRGSLHSGCRFLSPVLRVYLPHSHSLSFSFSPSLFFYLCYYCFCRSFSLNIYISLFLYVSLSLALFVSLFFSSLFFFLSLFSSFPSLLYTSIGYSTIAYPRQAKKERERTPLAYWIETTHFRRSERRRNFLWQWNFALFPVDTARMHVYKHVHV